MKAGVNGELALARAGDGYKPRAHRPMWQRLLSRFEIALKERMTAAMLVSKHPRPPVHLIKRFHKHDERVDIYLRLCVRWNFAAYSYSTVAMALTKGECDRLERLLGAEALDD